MTFKDIALILFVIAAVTVVVSAQSETIDRTGLVGTWKTGGMSIMADRNTVTGSTTPSNGNTLKFEFDANGRFSFVGYMQSTMYGCTTALFNDKQGRYALSGSKLTLRLNKNFWRNTYSCSPGSNKERNYTLDPESYEVSTKRDEYGKLFVCLSNEKGETCYRRESE